MAKSKNRLTKKCPHNLKQGEYIFTQDKIFKVVKINNTEEVEVREGRWYEYLYWGIRVGLKHIKDGIKERFKNRVKPASNGN